MGRTALSAAVVKELQSCSRSVMLPAIDEEEEATNDSSNSRAQLNRKQQQQRNSYPSSSKNANGPLEDEEV